MKKVLRALLGGVAPMVATAVGGPLAGTAVKMLAEKLNIDVSKLETEPETVEEAIVKKLTAASPADWLAVKKAETDFLAEMRKLDISEEQIHAMDRDSARKRQMTTGDSFPNVLASVVILSFVAVLALQFAVVFKQIAIDPTAGKVLDVSLGILMAAVTQVLTYYFGSSSGSKAKTALLGEKTS